MGQRNFLKQLLITVPLTTMDERKKQRGKESQRNSNLCRVTAQQMCRQPVENFCGFDSTRLFVNICKVNLRYAYDKQRYECIEQKLVYHDFPSYTVTELCKANLR